MIGLPLRMMKPFRNMILLSRSKVSISKNATLTRLPAAAYLAVRRDPREPVSVRGRKKPIALLFNLEHPDVLAIVTEVERTMRPTKAELRYEAIAEAHFARHYLSHASALRRRSILIAPHSNVPPLAVVHCEAARSTFGSRARAVES